MSKITNNEIEREREFFEYLSRNKNLFNSIAITGSFLLSRILNLCDVYNDIDLVVFGQGKCDQVYKYLSAHKKVTIKKQELYFDNLKIDLIRSDKLADIKARDHNLVDFLGFWVDCITPSQLLLKYRDEEGSKLTLQKRTDVEKKIKLLIASGIITNKKRKKRKNRPENDKDIIPVKRSISLSFLNL